MRESCCIGYKIKLMATAIDFQGYRGQHTFRNTVPYMLLRDVHKAQKTQADKAADGRLNTLPVIIPAGCTSLGCSTFRCMHQRPLKDRIRGFAD